MQTIGETRRERMEQLIAEHGSIAKLNEALGLPRTDATLSQIRTQAPHSRTGKLRTMGDELARRIETTLSLPIGWMDTPLSYDAIHGDQQISRAVKVMEAMPEWQRDQAIKILDTLAQPPERTGTLG